MINDIMNNHASAQPTVSFDISQLPKNFGTGRLQDLIVSFDNFNDPIPASHRSVSFPVKCDSFFTFTLVSGEVRLRINLHDVVVRAGQLLVMMPGCILEGQDISDDAVFYGLIVETDYMEVIRKNIGLRMDLTQRYYYYTVHSLTPSLPEIHVQMYKLICAELNRDDYRYKKEVVQRYCEIWMLKALSLGEDLEQAPELNKALNRKEQIFHDFLALLEQFYTQERSISFYADRMCLTPKYLSTIIKEISGKHGMQWIDEYVTLEAKALLRNSNLSVKQVSDQLNFPSQSMFGRFFKKMTGYSPKRYKML